MKFGVMFDFRNPEQWRRPDPAFYRAQLDEIVRLDELGYDDVWLTEHHFVNDGYNPAVLPAAAAIAVRTSRIRIGTFVLLMPFHDPVRVAEDAICVIYYPTDVSIWVLAKAIAPKSSAPSIFQGLSARHASPKVSNWSIGSLPSGM
jgi:Luciferase-like monooxygenase